ncbi:hypothetical protein MUCCIDRAFT_108542 [Mucor lusitanicus CBS 277.49]|uniref:PX domain-containing protein n=1 Tax=Mucor lusitanicus CBS 277.49 TaxID=747725 RepID=A0A162QPN0_MUCCL|nr:hypothetical protein MUCCIDRAFT_108542 [Mucor lusitanicus CBS 277.49]
MLTFSDVKDDDNVSINTAYTDNNTLVDRGSIYALADDDTATLTNEITVASKQNLAESVITSNDFPSTRIKVVGMNVHPHESDKKQVYSTIISIRRNIPRAREDARSIDTYKELWKIEKRFTDFVNLHSKLTAQGFDHPLPSVYKLTNNSPINCDKRILQLELYFNQAMAFTSTRDPSCMCTFLNSDIFDEIPMNPRASKEGLLSDVYPQHFDYANPDPTTNCRHGLVIRVMERRGITDQRVEYQFCAFTDQDRDEWVKLIDKATKSAFGKNEALEATNTPLLSKLADVKK